LDERVTREKLKEKNEKKEKIFLEDFMKRIINKLLFASILIGLLVFTACDDIIKEGGE